MSPEMPKSGAAASSDGLAGRVSPASSTASTLPPRPIAFEDGTVPDDHLWGRRDWLTRFGWTAVLGSLGIGTLAFVRLLYRRAPIEAPTLFQAGRVVDYAANSVSDRYMADWRVFIVRDAGRLFAIYGRCTHLGCTPRWKGRDHKFKCPCHGSGFTRAGVNFEGPAPRPLERARVWQDRDGRLWVDVARRYRHDQWELPGACIELGPEERNA